MAKKPTTRDPPIQFRPGNVVVSRVAKLANDHNVEVPEMIRRLVCLATMGLSYRHHDTILAGAVALGGTNAFANVCVFVQLSVETSRKVTGKPLLHADEDAAVVVAVDVLKQQVKEGTYGQKEK